MVNKANNNNKTNQLNSHKAKSLNLLVVILLYNKKS